MLIKKIVLPKNSFGFKLGEFSPTKCLGKSIHNTEKNNKKKLKRLGKKK